MKNTPTKKYIYLLLVVCVLLGIFLISKYNKEGFDNNIKYLDEVDVIYWINLDRSTDRRQKMGKMFKDDVFKGIDIVRVSAVDGSDPNIDTIIANNTVKDSDKATPVEYSCLLSHLNAIKTFMKSDHDIAMIMEDDMTLEYKPYWDKSINKIMENAPTDWEIIQLCYSPQLNIPTKQEYTLNERNFWGCCCYLINKKGINKQKIINNKYKLNNVSNHTADDYIFYVYKTYVYKYPMFIWEYNNDSTIHQSHVLAIHNPIKKNFDKMYADKY